MTGTPDAEPNFLARIAEEIAWLKDHPEFDERPASIKQFLGPGYLDIRSMVRDRLVPELVEIFGEEPNPYRIARYQKAIFTGGIGTGKSTMASIALCYMVHWLLCLKNPQKFFNLLPGSRIAVMMMSTSGAQARGVIFGDIKARVDNSDWFKKYPYDKKFVNQIRFKKVVDGNEEPVWIIPGDSAETSFEGFNILCLDEETEILTKAGWRRYDDLVIGEDVLTLNHETGMSEWQPLDRVVVHNAEPRDLILMEGNEFSCLSTPEHRWPTTTRWGARRWKETQTLNTEDRIPIAAESADRPTIPKYTDAMVEAVAWWYTEGSGVAGSSGVIYQKHGTKSADRIRACLTELFGPPVERFQTTNDATTTPMWRENITKRNLSEFRMNRIAAPVLRDFAPDRTPTHEFLLSLTKAQLDLFIEVSLAADNCGPRKLAQKEHKRAEAFAFAAILAGWAVSIRIHKTPNADYDMLLVTLMKKRQINPRLAASQPHARLKINTVNHKGVVWCPTVQNGTWLARRKGSVYFTGNCGILDEIDSHKVTKEKDYAEQGLSTISNRVTSRFEDRGFVFCVGQMKSEQGFANRHYKEYLRDPTAYAVKLTIWESKGWHNYLLPDGSRNSFYYDMARKKILSKEMGEALGGASDTLLEVPQLYRVEFESDPVKALRDLAGIPPTTLDAFISQIYRVDESIERWKEGAVTRWATEDRTSDGPHLAEWFRAPDQVPRYVHIDVGITGDALGLVMGHSPGALQVDDELKPRIFIDLAMRITAPPGGEIDLNTVRHILYHLRDDLKFKIKLVTQDSYQSTDMQQQLQKRRFKTDILSMDREVIPYYDLREAINEGRVDMPAVMARMRPDEEPINILRKELATLRDLGTKIDHPLDGSKDVADALAGVVHNIMRFTKVHKNTGVAPSTMDRTTPVLSQGATVPTGPAIRLPGVRKPTKWRPPSRGR